MELRKRCLRLAGWLVLLTALTCWSTPAFTQLAPADVAPAGTPEFDELLRAGDRLEQQRRWSEALSHYEDAVRRHPNHGELQERLTLARLRYDVSRRYHDVGFVRSIRRLDEQAALDIYSEVLLKIHAHYVERPDWTALVAQGTTALQVALNDPSFVQQHRLSATAGQRAAFVADVRRGLSARPLRDRHDTRSAVLMTARQAERHLAIPAVAVLLEYTCSAAGALDDYSAFLTQGQLDEVLSQIEGNFVGLGIELKADQDSLLIVNVIPGGPAHAAGVRPGERIVEVDGLATVDVSADVAADMLRGAEGSSVRLVLVATDGLPRHVQITRSRVVVPSVEEARIVDKQHGIAYLHLSSFQKTTGRDVETALWELHRDGMQSVIVDVRGNPGGLLTAAVDVADKFLAQGAIVSTRGRSAGEDNDYQAHLIGTWRVPLVVLIDGESASASEIFAGAIRDHHRGVVVGHRSYGKGSVQGIFPLSASHMGVRLTTAKFYSPNGTAISRRGIEPDILVRTTARVASDTQRPVLPAADPVLDAGLHVARQQLRRQEANFVGRNRSPR